MIKAKRKRKIGKIKTIIFDIGGVLQLTKYDEVGRRGHHCMGVHQYLAKKFRLDLDSWFDYIDTAYGQSLVGKISRKKALSDIARNLETSERKLIKLFHKAYKKNFKKNKKLFKIAFGLKEQGYKLGVLSDQWYLSKDFMASKKEMKGFAPVIISCDVGVRKPDIKIYKLLIKKCKCKPEEILFVDNREFNLKPARKLGIKTIFYKNNKQLFREFKKMGLMG